MRDINSETLAANRRVVERLTEAGRPIAFSVPAPAVHAGYPKLTEAPEGFNAVGTAGGGYMSDEFLEVSAQLEQHHEELFVSEHPDTGDYTFWVKQA